MRHFFTYCSRKSAGVIVLSCMAVGPRSRPTGPGGDNGDMSHNVLPLPCPAKMVCSKTALQILCKVSLPYSSLLGLVQPARPSESESSGPRSVHPSCKWLDPTLGAEKAKDSFYLKIYQYLVWLYWVKQWFSYKI